MLPIPQKIASISRRNNKKKKSFINRTTLKFKNILLYKFFEKLATTTLPKWCQSAAFAHAQNSKATPTIAHNSKSSRTLIYTRLCALRCLKYSYQNSQTHLAPSTAIVYIGVRPTLKGNYLRTPKLMLDSYALNASSVRNYCQRTWLWHCRVRLMALNALYPHRWLAIPMSRAW